MKSAGNLSTLFDVGGIVGGILAGYLSDKLSARAITAATFMFLAIPSMLLYRFYGGVSMTSNIVLMMIVGMFVNGPYALITTAVSADLGTHRSLKGDSRALATVTAIIDGTGSVGAAFGPLLTGFLSTKGWDEVFLMLMAGALIAGLLLSRLVITEIHEIFERMQSNRSQRFAGNFLDVLNTFNILSEVSLLCMSFSWFIIFQKKFCTFFFFVIIFRFELHQNMLTANCYFL